MAYIDKTYTNSRDEYSRLKQWIMENDKEFPYEFSLDKIKLSDCLFDWNKEDFNLLDVGENLPVLCTPSIVDVFMLLKCPLVFVTNRIKEVYSEDWWKFVLEYGMELNKQSDKIYELNGDNN